MNIIPDWWSKVGLQMKLQILIQGFLFVILLAAQHWISGQIEQRSLQAAEDRTSVVADGVINSLNTLMSTNVKD
jgi:hypothetical protein